MADSFKHIEEHFKKSMQDYTIPNSTGATGFASVMAAANKKLFFKFMPKRFNFYYLSAAVTVSVASTTIVMISNNNEPELIKADEIVIDSAEVYKNIENAAIFDGTVQVELMTEGVLEEIVTSDTIDLTPPENPFVSTSKEIIPETFETAVGESTIENNEIEQTNITKTKPVQIDSIVIIEKEDVLIKNSEKKVIKQKVKKKGR